MPFQTEPISETQLETLEDVRDWISDTQRSLNRIPIEGVLEQGATFLDDAYLGDGDTLLHFNRPAFVALCQRLGCRKEFLEKLETPSLASQVLNDLLAQREVRNTLSGDEFVMDERSNTVIGLVSKTYVTYTNDDFITDIENRLSQLSGENGMAFQGAYGINTDLTIRYVSTHEHGTIQGRGGRGVDKSRVGLQFLNSMVGTSAVVINYYLDRLVCANGMMVPAASSVNRVNHSGRKDSFHIRMDRSFREVVRNIGQLKHMLNTLGDLPFQPAALSQDQTLAEKIFEVISGSKQQLCDEADMFLRYPIDATRAERERLRLDHDTRLIGLIPTHFGGADSSKVFKTPFRDGATIFDFVNVFTEYAKTQRPSRKLEIEERAGTLATYIAGNARKL